MAADNIVIMLKALDGLAARGTVIAQNIANAGTPNYRPLRLRFEQALRDAALVGDEAVRALAPTIAPVPAGAPEAHQRLDLELAAASTTALRYGALIDMLGRQMQLEALAVRGNN
ncbi:flagellar basal body rod protein FlgB [Flavisphingomonas formosensis]|uniref:flagellar basal body rod protein FlgB n=1 Tax=Flavisphingomonas formosensis TaxID=861534 RepID=UPI0012F837A0|nr:hypothetical protein [Sphingomonas formosensis]